MISLGSPSFDSQAREFSRYRLMMMIEGLRERDRGGGATFEGMRNIRAVDQEVMDLISIDQLSGVSEHPRCT